MNIKKYWIPILIGSVGVYYIIRSLKKPASVLDENGEVVTGKDGVVTSDVSGNTTTNNSGYPLKKGDKGDLVGQLQTAIGVKYLPKYGVDKDFGAETEQAVIKFLGKPTVESVQDINKILQINTKSGLRN